MDQTQIFQRRVDLLALSFQLGDLFCGLFYDEFQLLDAAFAFMAVKLQEGFDVGELGAD